MPRLTSDALLHKLLESLALADWSATASERNKPFLIRCSAKDGRRFAVRVYIWNCTHGGGAKRPANEYRIQFTGNMPAKALGEVTLLLGWHDGYGVFAAWDIDRHDGQVSSSPSAQIRLETLERAHVQSFSIAENQHGEIVVAFKPEFLADYALSSRALHRTGQAVKDYSLLNDVPNVDESNIVAVSNAERREVISRIVRRYRASDFRRRVLAAYSHACAVCGIQLDLVEAAHIDPVSQPGSTDETRNGIALCGLHHAAFDSNLISFDEKYRIQISSTRIQSLVERGREGGIQDFRRGLRAMIALPADRRDYPDADYISKSRKARGWKA